MIINTLLEQGTGKINEDFCFAEKDLFGVFDGATSLSGERYADGVTGGYLASNIAGRTFRKNNDRLENLVVKANHAIDAAMTENGVARGKRSRMWSASAAVVRISDTSAHWLQIGDCVILLIYEDASYRLVTNQVDHDLETLLKWRNIARKTDQTIMQALAGQIEKVRTQMNISYGVLNGEETALSFVQSGNVSLKGVAHLVLFTDGLLLPKENPEDRYDFGRFTELFLSGGLPHVRQVVREIEEKDVECRQYPRFKTHDDIAAISLSF